MTHVGNRQQESLQVDGFTLREVMIEGRTLLADVSYSGGCAEHDYQLYMSPDSFDESAPVPASLWLQHEDNDDFCKAIVSETLHFDLTPVLDPVRFIGSSGEQFLQRSDH